MRKTKPIGPILNGIQTAAALNMDPKTLRKYVKAGTCPVPPIAGMKPPAWKRSDVEAFVGGRIA